MSFAGMHNSKYGNVITAIMILHKPCNIKRLSENENVSLEATIIYISIRSKFLTRQVKQRLLRTMANTFLFSSFQGLFGNIDSKSRSGISAVLLKATTQERLSRKGESKRKVCQLIHEFMHCSKRF